MCIGSYLACVGTQVVQVASGTGAVVLPMVKDLFLIGLLVVEGGGGRSVKPGKLKPVRPVWPPRKATSKQSESWATSDTTTNLLNTQQLTEIVKVARSLSLACVMDQVTPSCPVFFLTCGVYKFSTCSPVVGKIDTELLVI
jgi:hypothetical protein